MTDDELASYARAYVHITAVQTRYQQEAQTATSAEQVQALQQGMNGEIAAALQAEGLSAQHFDEFLRNLEQDSQLRTRFEQAVNEQGQGQGAQP